MGLDVPDTALEVRKLIAQEPAAIPENSFFAALTARIDAFQLENDSLQSQVNELNLELSSRQDSEGSAKLTELRQCMTPICMLSKRSCGTVVCLLKASTCS